MKGVARRIVQVARAGMATGDACEVPQRQSQWYCTWGDHPFTPCRTSATCGPSGHFMVAAPELACTQPASGCPSLKSDNCSEASGECIYADGSDYTCVAVGKPPACRSPTPIPSPCPSVAPNAGAPCSLASGTKCALGGCGSTTGLPHYACPGSCIGAAFATFDLMCSHNDLTSVVATGPCSMPDASLSWYTGTATEYSVSVASSSPGPCHVQLTFATGFTYSKDVMFTSQTNPNPPGCPQCPAFIGPTEGPFTVNNPADTCVSNVADAGSEPEGSRDAARDE